MLRLFTAYVAAPQTYTKTWTNNWKLLGSLYCTLSKICCQNGKAKTNGYWEVTANFTDDRSWNQDNDLCSKLWWQPVNDHQEEAEHFSKVENKNSKHEFDLSISKTLNKSRSLSPSCQRCFCEFLVIKFFGTDEKEKVYNWIHGRNLAKPATCSFLVVKRHTSAFFVFATCILLPISYPTVISGIKELKWT